ncbi:phage tail sheath family protein [Limobrevibacterium gyesilva]|uniref:Phage tail sheath subtilisin-like domain-containing protein n=1 Tax=Limobrevibacterium gyesilva TaxID=2991712 RepID=A0AA42CF35_9PROT|nr:phage tail sheath subtilisin-like domain-containing protein [Limobrevibacterium gyesilva]MCW3476059.1 phage tail sheath subtilisin-like domain-containing protein [Limobrevibacterium gyesilva]
MPVQVSYPGVYIDEQLSGSNTITPVSTSTAAFIGMARLGRLDTPTRVTNLTAFQKLYGTDASMGELVPQVGQFFLNGGSTAWITRIADATAAAAAVTLANEAGQPVLTLTALDAGTDGNLIRAEIDYDTPNPESSFNLTLYRRVVGPTGTVTRTGLETFTDLSINPASGRFIETVVNANSALVSVAVNGPAVAGIVAGVEGVSFSGLIFPVLDADAHTAIALRFGNNPAATRSITISLDGQPAIPVTFAQEVDLPTFLTGLTNAINTRLTTSGLIGTVTVTLRTQPNSVTGGRLLEIRSAGGGVVVSAAPPNDAASLLQLGVANGGLEISRWSRARPAPTGLVAHVHGAADDLQRLRSLASATQGQLASWTLTDPAFGANHTQAVAFTFPAQPMYAGTTFVPAAADTVVGSLLNVRQNLGLLATSIAANSANRWSARTQALRLALTPRFEGSDAGFDSRLTSAGGFDIGAAGELFEPPALPTDPTAYNVRAYTVGQTGGAGGAGPFQSASVAGNNGGFPQLADYEAAFAAIDREVDIFNIMVLPRALGQSDAIRTQLWGPASAFCQQRRAFLIVDPPSDNNAWADVNQATDPGTGIAPLRIGITLDHAAIYWPRLLAVVDGVQRAIDPSGTQAGLYARIDSSRGVWKAPAGLEANLLGVLGVEHRMTDADNGIINPQAVNALRIFPNGIVSWGARTMAGFDNSGNDDFKYVPVRRLTLLIEESLYRGLRFAVFEPNDEPLWARIRLAAGGFMNNLFRQGAFKGAKSSDAYFVKCDAETTTQNDIDLGIVNVVVGFAPLKPAEFVIVVIRQIAGQVQV